MADLAKNDSQPVVTSMTPETKCQDGETGNATAPSAEKMESDDKNVANNHPEASRVGDASKDADDTKRDTSAESRDISKDAPEHDVKRGDTPNASIKSVESNVVDAGPKSQGNYVSPNSVENTGQTVGKGSVETKDKASVNDWAKIKSIDTNVSDDLDDLLDTDIVQISLKYGSNDTPDSLNTDDADTSYKEMSPDELFDGPASDKLGELLSHKKGLENVLAASSVTSRRFSESYIEDQIHEADAAIDNILKGYKREIKRTQSYDPSYAAGIFPVKRQSSPIEGNVLQKRIKKEQVENAKGDVHPPIAIIEPFDISSTANKTSDIIEKLEATPCSVGKTSKEDSNSSAEQDKQNIRSILDEMDSKLSDFTKDTIANVGVKDSFQTSDGSNWTFTSNVGTPKSAYENKQSDTPPNVNPFNEFDNLFDGVLEENSEVNTSRSNSLPKVSDTQDIVAASGPRTPGSCGPRTPGSCGPRTPGSCGPRTPGSYDSVTVSSHSMSSSSHYSTSVPSSMVNTDAHLSSDRPPSLGHIPNYQNPLGVSRDNMGHPPHSAVSQVGMQFSQGNMTSASASTVSSDMMAREHERRLVYAEQQRARVNMHYNNTSHAQSKTPLNDLYSMVQPDGSGADFMQAREMAQQRRSPAYQGVHGGRTVMPNAMMHQYPPGARTGNVSPGYAQVAGNRVGGMPPGYVNQMGNPMGNPMGGRGEVVSPAAYSTSPASSVGPLSPGYAHPPNGVNNMNNMPSSHYAAARSAAGMGNSGDISMGPRMPYGQTGMQYPGGNYRNMPGNAGNWPGQHMSRTMQQGVPSSEMAQRMQYHGQMAPSSGQSAGPRFPSAGSHGGMPASMDRNLQMQMYQQQQQQLQQQRQAAAAQDPMMRMRTSEMRQGMMDPYGRDPSAASMMPGAQGAPGRQMMSRMDQMQSERMAGMTGANVGGSMMPNQPGQGQANRWPAPNTNMVRPNMQANMPSGMQYNPRMQQNVRPTGAGVPPGMSDKMYMMKQQQLASGGAGGGASYGNYPPGAQPGVSNKPNMDNQNLIDILNQRQDAGEQHPSRGAATGAPTVLGNTFPNVKLGNDATFGDLQMLSSDNSGYPQQGNQGY